MPPSVAKVGAGLTVAVVAVSTSAVLILLAEELPPLAIAAGRVSVTAVALLVLGRRGVGPLLAAVRRDPRLALRIGLAAALLGLHFGTWIASLTMTSVLRSMALVSTQPIFAGVIGRLTGDRVSPSLYLGASVAMLGTAVLAGPSVLETTDTSMLGDGLALAGALSAAGYLAVGRSVRSHFDLGAYLGAVHAFAALFLVAAIFAWAALGGPPVPVLPDVGLTAAVAVVALGLVPGVMGHGLLNWAVRFAPVHLVSLVIVLEPIGATALVALFIGTTFTGLDVLGAALLLGGVALGLRPQASSGS